MATKNDIPEVAAFMTDFWKWIKANWEAENTEAYAKQLGRSARELDEKYKDCPFVHDVLFSGALLYFSDKAGGRKK